MALGKREPRQIAILINEQVEDEIADARRLTARMLEQVEIWSPCLIERDDFSIDHRVLGQIAQGLDDLGVLPVEGFSIFGIEIQFAFRVDCDSAVSIELDS
jgi:hypothetical protein